MKKHYLSGLLLVACISSTYAQVLPDPLPQAPSNSNFYYKNLGQVIDENGNTHSEIKYYTEHAFPAMYLADDKISFVASKPADTSVSGSQDTIARIDMQFLCNSDPGAKPTTFMPCGVMHAYQPSQDHLNYYLPHTPGGITNVPGYARIVYEDAFPGIDVHFYSNAAAMKAYIVVKPGGDPNDIKLKFTGQDSIGYISGGSLAVYLRSWNLQFPQAVAYQIDSANNTSVLGWLPTWVHNGSGEVTITIGTYNTSEDLVIMIGGPLQTTTGENGNLEWATYYGADGIQQYSHITANEDEVMYHVLAEAGGFFQSFPGELTIPPTQNNGASDWYVSKFDQDGVRQWATYYGGDDSEWPTAIKESYPASEQGAVWVAGYTLSYGIDLGQATGFQQTANAGVTGQYCQDGLLASFDKTNGELIHGTYFGGVGSYEFINDLSIDPTDGTLYIVGTTYDNTQFATNCTAQTTGKFPLCTGSGNAFFQGSKATANDREGFIAKFGLNEEGNTLAGLEWSTLFGGNGSDYIFSVYKVHNTTENALYIGGKTSAINNSGTYPSPIVSHTVSLFPLADPGGSAFFQPANGPGENLFLAKFDENDQLNWCSFFGSTTGGGFKGLAFNSNHQLYALSDGVDISDAATPSSSPNALGKIPVYATGSSSSFSSSTCHMVIMRLNTDLSLGWSTFLPGTLNVGSSATGFSLGLGVDQHDYVFTATTLETGPEPVYNLTGAYFQPENASENVSDFQKTDGYILAFDNAEQAYWGTFLGGAYPASTYNADMNAYDNITELATGGNYIFFTGDTRCFKSPYKICPSSPAGVYCDQSYNPTVDAFIARFTFLETTGLNELELANDGNMLLYPNPSNGMFSLRYTNELSASRSAVMTITDRLGRTISSTTLKLKPGDNSLQINVGNLADGIYFLEINNDGHRSINKFIKQ